MVMAVEGLDPAVAHIPEVGGRDVELGPRRLDHACGRIEWPEEGALDRQLDRDHVPEHVDPVQVPVNVGKEFAHPDDHIAQLLTPVALLARHTADAVEHTVLGEQIDEPLDVEDITLRQVVRAAHERFGVGCHCKLPSGASIWANQGSPLGR
jgi:hypothetical protein